MSENLKRRQIPDAADAMVRELAATLPPEEAARLLANTVNRATALLHRLARDQAAARKGDRSWAGWAKLVNASRNAVLAASMCREVANSMAANEPGEVRANETGEVRANEPGVPSEVATASGELPDDGAGRGAAAPDDSTEAR